MTRAGLAILALLVAGGIAIPMARSESGPFVPAKGFVPDAANACRIAEAVWIPIYGEKLIAKEKPCKATLRGDV
jgi:hypothetical protein